jgi:hypothetical protein
LIGKGAGGEESMLLESPRCTQTFPQAALSLYGEGQVRKKTYL